MQAKPLHTPPPSSQRVLVVGAGAWGTAVAISAARHPAGHSVQLWARDAAQAQVMQQQRENPRYLPGQTFPDALQVCGGPQQSVDQLLPRADLVILATPVAGLRQALQAVQAARMPVAWLCKGFERVPDGAKASAVGLMPHEIQQQVAPGLQAGVLSGPSFALEVARGQPAALVAASSHPAVVQALVSVFHGPSLRVYGSDDIVGVEVGGAVKNVLAIATGLADGLELGLNARAALITRGLAEMARLGVALGARPDTFMGLAGLGDLVLTATGDLSRNRQVGLQLASGKGLEQAVASLGHVAEGVYSARTVVQRARHLGVEMPIAESMLELLDGKLSPEQAVAALMERQPRQEGL